MSQHLQEAFEALTLLEEEDFDLSASGIEDMKDFMENEEEVDFTDVIDPEAETEEDLEDSYIGKVILDCVVCHSKIYKDANDVAIDGDIDEETIVNEGEECPFCYSVDGYTVVGQVAPFSETKVEVEVEPKDEKEEEVEVDETEEVEESCGNKKKSNKSIKESLVGEYSEKLFDAVDNDYINKDWLINAFIRYLSEDDIEDFCRSNAIEFEDFNESLKEETTGQDLSRYQKWVDYDMENYHKISNVTMNKIKKAGLSVVKDQYGDYEVISDRKDESLKESNLQEKKWDATLEAGKALRRAIEEEDYAAALEGIRACYKEMLDKGIIDEDDFDSWTEDFDYLDLDGEDAEEVINYELDNLYDACDNLNVWIPLLESATAQKTVGDEPLKEDLENNLITLMNNSRSQYGEANWLGYQQIDNLIKEEEDEYCKSLIKKELDLASKFYNTDKTNIRGYYNEDENGYDDIVKGLLKNIKETIYNDQEEKAYICTDDQGNDFFVAGNNGYYTVYYPANDLHESLENIDVETEHDKIHIEAEEKVEADSEMIAPLDVEAEEEIKDNSEDVPEEIPDKDEIDFSEFDEESFDTMGESYLKKVYENINSFRTSKVMQEGNSIIVEGIINFKSGKNKKTSFKFEAAKKLKNNKVLLVGENLQISKGKKSFSLKGSINENTFISESLNYNYRVNGNRIYGTINEAKDLSKVDGSMSKLIQDNHEELDKATSKEDLLNKVKKLFNDNKLDTTASRRLIMNIAKSRSLESALQTVYNSYLAGSDLKVK